MKLIFRIYIIIASINFCHSQTIFQNDSLTILADSLHLEGFYPEAITIRKQAIDKAKNAPSDYQTWLKAKYYHTCSANLEHKSYNYYNPDAAITKKTREQYLDSALYYSEKARDLYFTVKKTDKKFQYNIQNRIYHQTAYLGNWQHALEQAQLGLSILKDTLAKNDKTFVDLIYDIGYIYSQLGDYSKAVENYQSSLNLYTNIIGENHTDVAQAYNNIAVEYRNLGLHKQELESLLKAKTIWETLNSEDDKRFLYRCYSNLFYWYSYYGDFEKAEEYLAKKQNLRSDKTATKNNGFLRNKEEMYEDKLREWYDLLLHNSRKKDTVKTEYYAQNILKTIQPDKKLLRFETSILSSTLKFYASFIQENNKEEALQLLDKAIAVQHKYKAIYYTKELPFLLAKADLLLADKKNSEAKKLLNQLEKVNEKLEISEAFNFAILKAQTSQALDETAQARYYFDAAFQLLKKDTLNTAQTGINNLKPLISFEVIEGLLDMGNFCMQLFTKNGEIANLEVATNRYLLAADIYNQLYLGTHYNERLYQSFNAINTSLLEACTKDPGNQKLLAEVLNSIENNGSKLTWSKFVYNNRRQQLHLPERLVNKEKDIKAQLNFYQKELLDAGETTSTEKITLWKNKVVELKNELQNIQDSIKQQNSTYYQFTIQDFDVAALQTRLGKNEAVLKFIQTNNKLYSFLLNNNTIQLQNIKDEHLINSLLKESLSKLKNRGDNYQKPFTELKELLLNEIDCNKYKKLTIIPDGMLQYFPFEALILTENMPDISYSSSLLLLSEQRSTAPGSSSINLGAFAASDAHSKLINTSEEVKNITAIFPGDIFLNATKNEFLKTANHFNILHLAMHSFIDEHKPEFSSLTFYGDTDNQLFISELYNESFNAKMAVLSACNTGNGFYENGEGVISLSRAFTYAGIPSTVMSLWKVDDEATAQIMTRFYTHLKAGETKDEALKNAKLDYLKYADDPLLKHPYYWSGFVIAGNTAALVEKRNYRWIWIFMLFLPLAFYRKKLFQFFQK
ncbi:MAG: CHAT domain-containing protein [Draconibacterium sp.]